MVTLSKIPVRTANAEKRARKLDLDENNLSPTEMKALRAEKRAAWRQARLKSLEQDALQAQKMIQNMNVMTDELLDEKHESLVFPRIAVKSRPGASLIVRETEKIVGEKITQRTEEVPCPITGEAKIRTVEYIEKIIETEVETCREKILEIELQTPEKGSPDDDDDDDVTDHGTFDPRNFLKKRHINEPLQTIVEVMNPNLGGDGSVNEIIIGRSVDDSSIYPTSFDSYNNDNNNSSSGLSLNAKMKNVLQELLENDRVKMNLTKSLTGAVGVNNEDDDDDDEDEEGTYQITSGGGGGNNEPNGNQTVFSRQTQSGSKDSPK